MSFKVAVLVGSLRKESFNRKMANFLIKIQPESLRLEIIEIGNLPLYNEDSESNPPKAWVEFRNQVDDYDGVIFVTPEYNRSMPAALKNALDVGSRPYGKSVWTHKPAAVISVSPGALGGFGANHHLRQSLVFLDMPILQQPEAYIGGAAELFEANGDLKKEDTKKLISKFLKSYAHLLEIHQTQKAESSSLPKKENSTATELQH